MDRVYPRQLGSVRPLGEACALLNHGYTRMDTDEMPLWLATLFVAYEKVLITLNDSLRVCFREAVRPAVSVFIRVHPW